MAPDFLIDGSFLPLAERSVVVTLIFLATDLGAYWFACLLLTLPPAKNPLFAVLLLLFLVLAELRILMLFTVPPLLKDGLASFDFASLFFDGEFIPMTS